ncbi:aldehyde dehydrogenase [Devosia sp. A369]
MIVDNLVKHSDKIFIGGEWVSSSGDTKITVTNSATEERFMTVPEATEADVDRAVAAAREAFDKGPWPRMTPQERAGYIEALADALTRLADQNAVIWTAETGTLHKIAKPSSVGLGDQYRFYAQLSRTYPFVEEHPSRSGGKHALIIREPVGVVGAIVPWNSPMSSLAKKVGAALAAGCTVVVKASPEAPGSAYLLAEACEAANMPPGVVNVLTADRAVSERLVRHPGVDKIAFTGSTAAGRRIGAICGERVARCTLELGGKSPAVVLDDFSIEDAAKRLAARATFLTGQACAALTRVIVTRKRHDELLEALNASFQTVRVGNPFDADIDMGPLATSRQRERVEGYIAKGQAEGAKLVTGGGRPSHLSRGFFVEPTLFGDVDNQSTIAQEEIFGPVLTVIAADNEEQAIEFANDTVYGLNASIFTEDADRAFAVARQLRSGTVGHNEWRPEFNLAFGGFKQSGIGREGGVEGFKNYLETKVVVMDEIPAAARALMGEKALQNG